MKSKLLEFVKQKHSGQVRKYTGEPYHNHLINVAEMASKTNANFGYEIGLCHDLFEDTDCNIEQLFFVLRGAGYGVVSTHHIIKCTEELTDVFTSENHPDKNRKIRKTLEAKRLFTISPDAQTVKYCDLIDNTSSIVEHDKRFAKKYLEEKQYILFGMRNGDKNMYSKALDVLFEAKNKLA